MFLLVVVLVFPPLHATVRLGVSSMNPQHSYSEIFVVNLSAMLDIIFDVVCDGKARATLNTRNRGDQAHIFLCRIFVTEVKGTQTVDRSKTNRQTVDGSQTNRQTVERKSNKKANDGQRSNEQTVDGSQTNRLTVDGSQTKRQTVDGSQTKRQTVDRSQMNKRWTEDKLKDKRRTEVK